MVVFSVAGLTLDLVGVLLLGWDLIRVQRRLRGDAEDRVSRLAAILDEIGGIDGWAETVRSDFQDWDWDEGRTVMLPGTFDPESARESFQEIARTIGTVGGHVLTLAKMQFAAIDADRATAGLSLRYTYVGLGSIVLGFCLQVIPYF